MEGIGTVAPRTRRAIIRIDVTQAPYFAKGHGVTIGSEMSGGVEDVGIWDRDLGNAMFGIEIKGMKKRGVHLLGRR